MHSGGTIFVDHASGLGWIENQVSLIASDTVRSKQSFESFAATCGVTVKEYHGDNGIF